MVSLFAISKISPLDVVAILVIELLSGCRTLSNLVAPECYGALERETDAPQEQLELKTTGMLAISYWYLKITLSGQVVVHFGHTGRKTSFGQAWYVSRSNSIVLHKALESHI